MKLIKKINRLNEEAQLVADLDQENVVEKDEVIEDNIKEVEKKAEEDKKDIKNINGKQPEEPKPIKENLEDAAAEAAQIKADAEVVAAQVMADAIEEENTKNAELSDMARKDIHDSLLNNLIQQFWALVDECQNAITTLKANDACDGCEVIEDIIAQEYINIGELEGMLAGKIEEPVEEPLGNDPIEDGEPEPFEEPKPDAEPEPIDDIDIEAEFAEIEEPEEKDDEPAPIDVDDDELM